MARLRIMLTAAGEVVLWSWGQQSDDAPTVAATDHEAEVSAFMGQPVTVRDYLVPDLDAWHQVVSASGSITLPDESSPRTIVALPETKAQQQAKATAWKQAQVVKAWVGTGTTPGTVVERKFLAQVPLTVAELDAVVTEWQAAGSP